MSQVKPGDTIHVHYQGKLEDGTVFDSSLEKEPMQVTLGEQTLIAGVEKALLGMTEGDQKTITVTPAEGYGDYVQGKELKINRDKISAELEPQPGMVLEVHGEDGGCLTAPITAVDKDTITIDGNHPLAGKTLTFELTLVKIVA